ncbi:hypothetical protein SLEP1_g19832 [Rubroshorea leprosula]|uniref:Integral membrane bound transporter domain-containing protein n=1 Tax=Rubroshorea leprosula TaxID=152421 RepID=A0AAV5J9N0_9ROSI|nr:hypothetical protein SLEP1_g19832 [Rubroshorea leprosula]
MPNPVHQRKRAVAVWRACLASAFRPALACTMVGFATLYGPPSFQRQVAFPSFSYVTVILIVTDATLGDALHACWLALYATLQSLGPAILSLWLIGPSRLTNGTTALAVALGGLVVALPRSTHLTAKRIALGQIVLVYVIAFINGIQTDPVMHPLHVAASTAVGVVACVLALLVPYPRLACWEEGMKWERLPFKFLRPNHTNSREKLLEIEIALKGMEMALENFPSFPSPRIMLDAELKDGLLKLEEHMTISIKQARNCSPCVSLTVPESNAENIMNFLQALQTIPQTHQELPSFFFLFCAKLLQSKPPQNSLIQKNEGPNSHSSKQNGLLSSKDMFGCWAMKLKSKRLLLAFKCSLSLGLAVLFGLMYSKPNGFWSGLPVATSLAVAREATFKVANVKAQGTVLGMVYGVLGCFVFERFVPIRFFSLLPWFIFSSFLRRSRMYGQAGGISAVIGAILILGRKNFGPPSEFAIARIMETFIGLSCSIIVDLLFQPTRASTLAKTQLSTCLGTLHECIGLMCLQAGNANSLLEKQKQLRLNVNELGKFIEEAHAEPNFWFLPFHSACYGKLLESLSKMRDLFLFGTRAIEFLEQELQTLNPSSRESLKKIDDDIKIFKESIGSLIKCLEEISLIKSLTVLDEELSKKNVSQDLELGKSSNSILSRLSGVDEDDNQMERMLNSFLQHSREVVDKIQVVHGARKELKSQVVLSLSALGYCMRRLMMESKEIVGAIRELTQWENPTRHVNLYEISCKIHSLYT